ncbi:MAG: sugar phosphate nucleotidyltransferase [Elusimicrobia bacterium]|nr:sugar phosphate nucleotidyltransferase [Elusimicrobiota bacterium]
MLFEKYAGIFAAGEGTRLKTAFPNLPKPMVPICGAPLIEWSARLLMSAGFEDITILLNCAGKAAKEHIKKTFPDGKFVFIIKDTQSSYESFRLVSQVLAAKADKFFLSAVDSFYEPAKLTEFINFSLNVQADAVLGVTGQICDEKPLWADTDGKGLIKTLGPNCREKKYAASGIYFFTKSLAEQMPPPQKYKALREYLIDITAGGARIYSMLMPQSVDVDDPQDIKLAEDFIAKNL